MDREEHETLISAQKVLIHTNITLTVCIYMVTIYSYTLILIPLLLTLPIAVSETII